MRHVPARVKGSARRFASTAVLTVVWGLALSCCTRPAFPSIRIQQETKSGEARLGVWFSVLESVDSFFSHEERFIVKSSLPIPPSRNCQVCVWRGLGRERIAYLFFLRSVGPDGKPTEGKPVLFDLAWDGKETRDAVIKDPFAKRQVGLGIPSGIDYNLYKYKEDNPAATAYPVWIKPDIVPGRIRTEGFAHYVKMARSVVLAGREVIENRPLDIVELTFPDDAGRDAGGVTEIMHRWWLDTERGFAPARFMVSYKTHGVSFSRDVSVTSWHKLSEEIFYPAEYTTLYADNDGAGEVRTIAEHVARVVKCQIGERFEESVFRPPFAPGVPVHVYDPGKQLVSAFVEDIDHQRVVVYETATVSADDRKATIERFVEQHGSDPRFRAPFGGYEPFTVWDTPAIEPGSTALKDLERGDDTVLRHSPMDRTDSRGQNDRRWQTPVAVVAGILLLMMVVASVRALLRGNKEEVR